MSDTLPIVVIDHQKQQHEQQHQEQQEQHDEEEPELQKEQEQQQRRRRKLWGRAARQRRKKKLEIQVQVTNAIQRMNSNNNNLQNNGNENNTNNNGTDEIRTTNSSNNTTTIIKSLLPTDRNRMWPSVIECRSDDWCIQDEVLLQGQLGYVPGNVLQITCRINTIETLYPAVYNLLLLAQKDNTTTKVVRSQDNTNNDEQKVEIGTNIPLAIQLYPLAVRDETSSSSSYSSKRTKDNNKVNTNNDKEIQDSDENTKPTESNDNAVTSTSTTIESIHHPIDLSSSSSIVEPFPTIYWLTHPTIRTLISGLEVEGYGTIYSMKLSNDITLGQTIQQCHYNYGKERYNLLTPTDQHYIKERKWEEVFNYERRGIAGIRYTQQCKRKTNTFIQPVKCLHTHTAHYLSTTFINNNTDTGSQENNNTTGSTSTNIIGQWVMEELEQRIQLATISTATVSSISSNTIADAK